MMTYTGKLVVAYGYSHTTLLLLVTVSSTIVPSVNQ